MDVSDWISRLLFHVLGSRGSDFENRRRVRNAPTYFGLHLTNFSCGADSFIEHFYKHVMADKAYLILELDEHSAVAGVMTRLEAYKNVIENSARKISLGLRRRLPTR